jgi:hypothetical protein
MPDRSAPLLQYRMTSIYTFALVIVLAGCVNDAAPDITIMEVMLTQVAPATDTIWGIEDPKTDEEWQVFADAADLTIAAFEQTKTGGTGPNDSTWAADPKWQVYSDQVIAAAISTKAAVAARDVEAMWDAGGELYTPCEQCHIDFNPGVQSDQ